MNKYNEAVSFEKDKELQFPDFTLTYLKEVDRYPGVPHQKGAPIPSYPDPIEWTRKTYGKYSLKLLPS